jgi:ABC-2 type transport system ATP-binding protein
MTGRQLIRFLCRLRGQRPSSETAVLARRLDIDLDRPLVHLSSGMKRKVALLQVLVTHAPLLILDEPTNTLDPTMRDELLGQLQRVRNQGQAVLFSSHVLAEVEKVCDRVAILKQGRLVHVQEMAHLRQSRLIRARFRNPPEHVPDLTGLELTDRNHDRWTMVYTGLLSPILGWLARADVTELQVESIGLGAIYRRYHGTEA